MPNEVRKATHEGVLKIGDMEIPCAVLEDGTRVLSERGVTKAIGGKRGGAHWQRKKQLEEGGAELPLYISANNLKPFIDSDLQMALREPLKYVGLSGGSLAHGLPASLLPDICNVLLKARDAIKLHPRQHHIAIQADMLMRGLAHVGIVALVDEATGYQAIRDRLALEKILERYISKELLKWAKRFPDDFYDEMFRLKGWQWKRMKNHMPGVVGKYTNDMVYERLLPRVLVELRKVNPKDERGQRKHKHHQWLTEDIGHPKLRDHLNGVIALMKASSTWEGFQRLLNRAFPKPGANYEFALEEADEPAKQSA